MIVDLAGEALLGYQSSQVDPPGFDDFWNETLGEARAFDLDVTLTRVDSPITSIQIFDLSFSGFAGERISAWLRMPLVVDAPLPAVVEFVGYGGGRGLAEDSLFWASSGFVHLQMDTRGQGAGWSVGVTPDTGASGPRFPGMMTSGIQDKYGYYYRRLMTDAVRAVEAAHSLPQVDRSRITSFGMSQGGGLALAVAGLSPLVSSLMSFEPFLCDFPRAIMITDNHPYKEISSYLRTHRGEDAAVLETLSFFDGVNFARRATAPAWFTTALMDAVCPPSTVVGAYNVYAGPKHLRVDTHNGHEHETDDDVLAARILAQL